MSERTVVGLTPWLPGPLGRSAWWTEPVRAERLAAFRIGMGAALFLDALGTYLPRAAEFFGRDSLGSPEVFAARTAWPQWRWTILSGIENPHVMQGVLLLWAAAGLCLMLGVLPRLSAVVGWALSVSILNQDYYLHNSGDNVRAIGLFYLMLCPSGAAWSLTSWWRKNVRPGPVYVLAWPLRLLFLQLMVIYFLNGLHKLGGLDWRSGQVMGQVMGNLAWTRFSYAQLPLPAELLPVMTYLVLFWELLFPILVCMPALRGPTLWLGVFFHVGTGLFLRLTMFPVYMLCLYLPLVPWEHYADDRWRPRARHRETASEAVDLPALRT
jgi:Vitamin K-dependent gamma-carboxylase